MQINRTTDYALRLLVYLGQENRTVTSSEMANSIKISKRYLLSVASRLSKQGFIYAGMGPNGGYALIKPLDQITLYDVIEYMEGTITISRCLIQKEHCEGNPCVLHGAYSFLQDIIECYLQNLTIDMLIDHPVEDWKNTLRNRINDLLQRKNNYDALEYSIEKCGK